MSKASDLLDAIKAKEGFTSNYRLSKFLDVEEARIGEYYKDISKPDDYASAKIALALNMDPMKVLAEIRAESEKNQKKREFWKGFLARAASFMIAALLTLLSVTFIVTGDAKAQENQSVESGDVHKLQIMRLLVPKLVSQTPAYLLEIAKEKTRIELTGVDQEQIWLYCRYLVDLAS